MQSHLVLVPVAALSFGLAGCGQASTTAASDSIGQGVQVSPTGTVTSATYTLTGPNGFTSAGTVPVGDGLDVPFGVSRIPVGQGYDVELSATASDGVTECTGGTTFDVTDPNATVMLSVQLECGTISGSVSVSSSFNLCPVIDDLTAAPLVVNLGGSSKLFVAAHDTDDGPNPLSYAWAVNGVQLPNQTQTTLSFACTSRGDVTIAAIASDGDPNPNCADSESVKVTCQ